MFGTNRQSKQAASAGNRARGLLVLLLLPAWLAAARADQVNVTVEDSHGRYTVAGELVTIAPPSVAWSVLTDYDHISAFVSSMKTSVAERSDDGRTIVRQAAAAGIFPVRKVVHVALEVREDPERLLVFRDVSGNDFSTYEGEWQMAGDSTGTRIWYRLQAAPRTSIPFVGRGIMRRSVRELLSQVGAEMARRAAGEGTPRASVPARLSADGP